MSTKLKNLRIKKVDFVDAGANPDAHIKLFKRNDKSPDKGDGDKSPGIMKKLLGFIGKAAGLNPSEIDSVMEDICKGEAVSFNEKFDEVKMRKVCEEIWDVCYALEVSLQSILTDEDMDSSKKEGAMQESLDSFNTTVKGLIESWSAGNTAGITTKNLEKGKSKGEEEEMKIDKSKLTPSELAFLESIEKRCGTEEGTGTENAQVPNETIQMETDVAKSVAPLVGLPVQGAIEVPVSAVVTEPDDVYKGLNPIVKQELEALKKFRDEQEEKELQDVAKKYVVIGKKVEELVPVLKSLKVAGGTAYNDMISVLDQTVETVEKSGAFSEIGKSGHGAGGESDGAWAKAEAKAVELMKSRNDLTKAQALDVVLTADPELARECEQED